MRISKLLRFAGCRIPESTTGMMVLILMLAICIDHTMAFGKISLPSIFPRPPPQAGYVRTKAYIDESPEIGIGFHKVPIMVPMPMLIFRKKKHLVTKPVMVPICQGCSKGSVHLHPPHATVHPIVPTYYPPTHISSFGRGGGYGSPGMISEVDGDYRK